MSQKKVYVFSPDGESEGWYMQNEVPAGWLNSPPEGEQTEPEVPEHTGGLTDVNDSGEETLEDLQKQLDELEASE